MNAKIVENAEVLNVINAYPKAVAQKLLKVRALIFQLSIDSSHVSTLQETFKWGEPSYVSNAGSTIRLAWKDDSPNSYSLFFVCTTTLLDTFRELYSEELRFKGNREIVCYVDQAVPEKPLRHCLELALCYKKLKHLPLLGS